MCVLFTITTTAIKGTATQHQHQQQQQHLMCLPNCLPTHLHALLLQSIPFFCSFPLRGEGGEEHLHVEESLGSLLLPVLLQIHNGLNAQMFSTLFFADADVC